MANVLSQEEIDALLGGLSGGKIDTTPAPGTAGRTASDVMAFDFTDQDRFIHGRLPTLETIHDRFARLLRQSLSTSLRRPVEIQIGGQTLCGFGDFGRALEKPSTLHLLRLEPLKGSGLLVLPGRLILTLVDLMFGGNGKPIEISEDRDFTLIENRVISKIADDVCRCYTESWTPVYPIHVQIAGQETNVQFINIVQPSDAVNVVDIEVAIEGNRSSLSICLPYTTIEPLKDTLKGAFIAESFEQDAQMSRNVRENLLASRVEVLGVLGQATITGRELLRLKKGDIVQLNEDFEHPVRILVEGKSKFWGIIGSHKSTRALQITGLESGKLG
ncbi:MAG: flagellar motor switch protein FliM [bacterium]|nr:flagellar motor switch protein FliM [bacterium]